MKNLKNILMCFLLTVGLLVTNSSISCAEDNSEEKVIRSGTFIKVLVPIEISTLMSDIDDEVWFLNTQDMYIYETNVLPQGTKMYGEVEDIREPVEGRDAAIKILITKMITPDKKVYKVNGHLYNENDNYIGGKETQPIYYKKVPHYYMRMKSVLQAVPLNILEMGQHTIIKPGSEMFIIFEDDVKIK